MRLGSLAFVFTVAFFSTHAFADPLQKSEDIVKFFDAASELGPPRGICVGTEEECNSKSKAAPAEKTSLDMLINFGLDSAELDATARAELDEFAKALKDSRLSTLNFVVEGHTDASGSADYNEGLSERRAQIGNNLPDLQRRRSCPHQSDRLGRSQSAQPQSIRSGKPPGGNADKDRVGPLRPPRHGPRRHA